MVPGQWGKGAPANSQETVRTNSTEEHLSAVPSTHSFVCIINPEPHVLSSPVASHVPLFFQFPRNRSQLTSRQSSFLCWSSTVHLSIVPFMQVLIWRTFPGPHDLSTAVGIQLPSFFQSSSNCFETKKIAVTELPLMEEAHVIKDICHSLWYMIYIMLTRTIPIVARFGHVCGIVAWFSSILLYVSFDPMLFSLAFATTCNRAFFCCPIAPNTVN